MKKFLVSLFVAFSAMMLPTGVFAYSEDVANLVTEMNNELAGKGGIKELRYDGDNVILVIDCSDLFSSEQFAMIKELVNTPEGQKMFVDAILSDPATQNVVAMIKSMDTGVQICLEYSGTELKFNLD